MIVHKHLLYLLVSNYRYKGGVVSVGQDGNNMYTRIINFFLIIARQKGFFSGAHLEYTVSIAISLRQLYMQSLDSKLHASMHSVQIPRPKHAGKNSRICLVINWSGVYFGLGAFTRLTCTVIRK